MTQIKLSKRSLTCVCRERTAIKGKEAVLNCLPVWFYTIEAHDKVLDNCKYTLATTQASHKQKQKNIGGLGELLKLKIDTKVMLTISVDIIDRLVNSHI